MATRTPHFRPTLVLAKDSLERAILTPTDPTRHTSAAELAGVAVAHAQTDKRVRTVLLGSCCPYPDRTSLASSSSLASLSRSSWLTRDAVFDGAQRCTFQRRAFRNVRSCGWRRLERIASPCCSLSLVSVAPASSQPSSRCLCTNTITSLRSAYVHCARSPPARAADLEFLLLLHHRRCSLSSTPSTLALTTLPIAGRRLSRVNRLR